MADYLVAGWWNDFSFLLTPDELKQVLQSYHLVIYNAHVPVGYTETPPEEYLATYQRFYDKLTGGENLKENDNSKLIISVSSDLSGCKYGKLHTYKDRQYLLADFDEPPVCFSPFALCPCRNGKEQLCFRTGYSFLVNGDKVMGLQLQYPKMIQYRQDSGYETPKSTKELAGYRDYVNLKNVITKLTKPLYVMENGDKRKTNVRVSAEVKERLQGALLMKENGFIMV